MRTEFAKNVILSPEEKHILSQAYGIINQLNNLVDEDEYLFLLDENESAYTWNKDDIDLTRLVMKSLHIDIRSLIIKEVK